MTTQNVHDIFHVQSASHRAFNFQGTKLFVTLNVILQVHCENSTVQQSVESIPP